MSYEPVDVYVKDQQNQPVLGVLIRVYSPTGGVFYTQGVTDEEGKASFLLSTQPYSMRFYKFRASFTQPQVLTVLEAPEINSFDVAAEVFTTPISNDARLCRCSGHFRNPDGTSQKYLDLHFYPDFSPILLDEAGVVPRKVITRTDADGFVQIDLIRGGCYRVTLEGMENEERFVRVPDLSGCNLPDMLFAVVERVTFDPPGPYAVTVGSELELTPTIYDSAGATLTGAGQNDVDWTSSDTNILGLQVKQDILVLTGVATGSAELRATRKDLSIIKIPAIGIDGQPITIDVL